MTAAEIGHAAGIPEDVIRDRFGLDGKHIAGPDDHVSTMSIAAAERLLERTGCAPGEIDVVCYFGSIWRDYDVWSCAPAIQHAIGAANAWAFEMSYVSCGTPVAMKVLRDVLRSDPSVRTVLAVGACRESHLLDYTNRRSRFMFNFADGAAAMLLQRGDGGHEVLESAIISDGSFADAVAVYGGGSRHPASLQTVGEGMHFLDVRDPGAMKERLDPISGARFVDVARRACEKSGIAPEDLALVAPIHFKRSFHEWIMSELGLPPERGVYLRRHGHMSGIDPLVGIDLRRADLSPGDHVLLLAAGTGYSWAASVVRW